MRKDCTPEREKVIQINEEAIRDHLGKLVRSTVEETLNGMLDAGCGGEPVVQRREVPEERRPD